MASAAEAPAEGRSANKIFYLSQNAQDDMDDEDHNDHDADDDYDDK